MTADDTGTPAPPIVCPNCGRKETRQGLRFCPNCGATLPVIGHVAAGFGALAVREHVEESSEPVPVLKPAPEEPPAATEVPHQPWDLSSQAPAPLLTGEKQRQDSKGITPLRILGGCLAAIGIVGVTIAGIFLLLFLGLLLICSGVHC